MYPVNNQNQVTLNDLVDLVCRGLPGHIRSGRHTGQVVSLEFSGQDIANVIEIP